MANRSEFHIWDRVFDGGLGALLIRLRDHDGLSWLAIRDVLRDEHDISITDETANRWYSIAKDEEATKAPQ